MYVNDTSASEAAAGPRSRGGRAAEIRAQLQEEIESGKLPPGTALDERGLAERFGVSRTPVREAVQQLAARDLVRIAPRHGVSVARLSITKVRSTLEYIGELEALCAKFAARRVDAHVCERLDAALEACRMAAERQDGDAYDEANKVFHEVIYQASRNEYLANSLRNARRLIYRYHIVDFHMPAQAARSLRDHTAIANAIKAGDEEAAMQAMLLHTPSGTTGFSEFLATVPMSLFEPESNETDST